MTGNGRCNFLNDDFTEKHFHSIKENNIKSLINNDNKERVLNFIKSLGIEPKIKNGYYYPFTNKSSTIRDALYEEALEKGVEFKFDYKVFDIKKENDKFIINNELYCDALVVSSGSKSYKVTGTEGDSYTLLSKLGLSVTELYPSLVQILCEGKFLKEFDGVRTDAIVSILDDDKLIKKESGELQLTDYGVSGICVFNLSRYVHILNKPVIKINFMPYTNDCKNYFDKLPNVALYNEYGPTENIVCTTCYQFDKDHLGEEVFIGKPIDNCKCYILDSNLNPQPYGIKGELYVSGPGLAKGYIGRNDLTEDRFIKNPFSDGTPDYELMYKTGDVVSINEEGFMQFHERVDYQVKHNGFRINLGEVESVISSCIKNPNVVVLLKQLESTTGVNSSILIAYAI